MSQEQNSLGKPIQTHTRWAKLARVFSARHDKELHTLIACLCVLFEDLRIELAGMSEDHLGKLDECGESGRRLYFLRRSIATLYEFATVLQELDQLPSFQRVKKQFNATADSHWTKAIRYFQKHTRYIARMRHHVGGHFGKQAAELAIVNLELDTTGALEIDFYRAGGGAKLQFASEIASTAMLCHVPGGSSKVKARKMIRHAVIAYRKAAWAVDCVTLNYLWKSFSEG